MDIPPFLAISSIYANLPLGIKRAGTLLELRRDPSTKCRLDLLKNLNNKAYEPQMVSFGPYHYGKEHLMTMEKHKHDMLLHFLNVSGKPLELICLRSGPGGARFERLLRCTPSLFACGYEQIPEASGPRWLLHAPYVESLGMGKCLFLSGPALPALYFLCFFSLSMSLSPVRMGKCLHVLDMYRKTLTWDGRYEACVSLLPSGITLAFWSANELTEAGIRLEPADFDKTQETISFDNDDGVLRLPRLVVDHATRRRNQYF
ncbi:hypothetical protein RHMOL_Rhmol08G0061300 [Rhododendron molle]|uniref:Uncharacterized protein n=1 Tax=Rhododendron molle TaxID=49168 RepID=A0ACC0MKG1_RHOML|nr:hypothetical protein RHMOL_Rhmol08G0061300 [Rhododendron molle]